MDELLVELKKYYGTDAEFRDGQEEAIRAVLEGKRTLVVQKTGWGKSLVYFMATKMLRKKRKIITLIISPLLSLMNNQVDSAKKLDMKVRTINSSNVEEWDFIEKELNDDSVDALIISPERLANDNFKGLLLERLGPKIGLFVVDEAHCISDWGHDFRPDYRRIVDIIKLLPINIPVLATTATANDRVVNDIKVQLGNDIIISRGSLVRESLALQVIKMDLKEERLAWLAKYVNELPGTGIVYGLTTDDCDLMCKWLNANNIKCEKYYSKLSEEDKAEAVERFMNNEIKVLAATIAFGMGFDKPDIGFVIHFQKPGNIVAYYQQIGRAGRCIDKAFAILLCGKEDDEINEYFINSAFPTEDLMETVIETVMEHPGIRKSEFERYVDMKEKRIDQCIKYLLVSGDIYKDEGKYYKTPKMWNPDLQKSKEITEIRYNELAQMNEFIRIDQCYMKYIAEKLDDASASECGRCSKCLEKEIISSIVSSEEIARAQQFIRDDFNIIEPRKKWPGGIRVDDRNLMAKEYQCEVGRVLSNYGDAGWGKLVKEGKYQHRYFSDELVEASYELLKDFVMENDIKWITNVSSLRNPNLVRDFTIRLAEKLNLIYVDAIVKSKDVKCQKELNNSYMQYMNANDSFEIKGVRSDNVLLVDDMVDSRWTFTTCGYKLIKNGSGKVYPFALANSATRSGEE